MHRLEEGTCVHVYAQLVGPACGIISCILHPLHATSIDYPRVPFFPLVVTMVAVLRCWHHWRWWRRWPGHVQGPAAAGQLVFLCGGDEDLFGTASEDLGLMGKVSAYITYACVRVSFNGGARGRIGIFEWLQTQPEKGRRIDTRDKGAGKTGREQGGKTGG